MAVKTKTLVKRIGITLLVIVLSLFLVYLSLRNNIHTVTPNQLYRSAQLSPERLERLVRQRNIKTVINLRSFNPQHEWYRDEVSVSQLMGINHYDISLSAYHLPEPAQLKRLIQLLQTAQRPILVHCQGGADRTGFAVAMWILMNGGSLIQAEHAFSPWYFVVRSDSLGKLVLPIYIKWLKKRQYETNSQHFLQWVSEAQLGHR